MAENVTNLVVPVEMADALPPQLISAVVMLPGVAA